MEGRRDTFQGGGAFKMKNIIIFEFFDLET